jgi:hypothetical protein
MHFNYPITWSIHLHKHTHTPSLSLFLSHSLTITLSLSLSLSRPFFLLIQAIIHNIAVCSKCHACCQPHTHITCLHCTNIKLCSNKGAIGTKLPNDSKTVLLLAFQGKKCVWFSASWLVTYDPKEYLLFWVAQQCCVIDILQYSNYDVISAKQLLFYVINFPIHICFSSYMMMIM